VLELGVKTLLAYLLGSLLGSLLLGRLRGVDIREQGSGNAGGTNALRTQGWGFALGVIVIDVGKALLAVGVLPGLALPLIGIDPAVDRDWLVVCCAAAVVVGHVYPVWYEFRGGKGAATLIGAVAVLSPAALVPILLCWLACVALSGYVGLGTMVATATLPIYFAFARPLSLPLLVFGIAMAAFVVYTHRSNIERMRAGVENRARRLWLLRPR
jgi:glycerol-3-phosphate acyltransferase PlsY